MKRHPFLALFRAAFMKGATAQQQGTPSAQVRTWVGTNSVTACAVIEIQSPEEESLI